MSRWWGKYFQKIHGKWRPFEKARYKYYPCPGCLLHKEIIGEKRGEVLFNKYCNKRPQSSYALYWRSHPEEYKRLLEIIDRQKNK